MAIGDNIRLTENDLLALLGFERANNELANRKIMAKDVALEGKDQEIEALKKQIGELEDQLRAAKSKKEKTQE